MCMGGGSSPSPPPPPPPPPEPQVELKRPKLMDEGVRKAREEATKRRAAFARSGTLLTGAGGLSSDANTQKKTLLGQ